MTQPAPETIAAIVAAYRAGTLTPEQTVARSYARIREHDDPAIFIALRDEQEARAEARALANRDANSLPLYGVPVAVKDNIDVAGLPTTAACPAFAYKPARDATAVARLRAAGAVVIGKTNLDQFATGLVGVRSPYGIPRNAIDPKFIPGGSSSGSAVAVAAGLVPLALGTDTAGSGRVPAGLNNIVGLKPSLGMISTAGVVPACRTLDCVSVFALDVDDAFAALTAMAGRDSADPYSRDRASGTPVRCRQGLRIGVPRAGQCIFFGDAMAAAIYDAALARLKTLGAILIDIDIEPFYETARLLYEGPWVAERYLAARALIASSPESMHPVTREIILGGARPSASRRSPPSTSSKNCAACATTCSVASMRSRCRPRRPSIRSNRCSPIRSSSTAGSAPIPISSICSISVGSRCRRRYDLTAPRLGITLLRQGRR